MIAKDAIQFESERLAQDVYRLIQTLDPATFKAEMEQAAEELVASIKERLAELQELAENAPSLQDSLRSLSATLDERAPKLTRDVSEEWRMMFQRLQPAYESLAMNLRARSIQLPKLRQTNHKRSIAHILNGFIGFALLEFVFQTHAQLIVAISLVALWCWSMEIGRVLYPGLNEKLMNLFGAFAHPHEHHQINSGTWYASALFLLALTNEPIAMSSAVMVLALADPAASLIGRRYGNVKLLGPKSVAGTAAFACVAFITTFTIILGFYPETSMASALLLASTASIAGAASELVGGQKVDDNFTIPVGVGLALLIAINLL